MELGHDGLQLRAGEGGLGSRVRALDQRAAPHWPQQSGEVEVQPVVSGGELYLWLWLVGEVGGAVARRSSGAWRRHDGRVEALMSGGQELAGVGVLASGLGIDQPRLPPVEDEGPGGPLGNLGENRGYYQEISDVSGRSGDAGPVCP